MSYGFCEYIVSVSSRRTPGPIRRGLAFWQGGQRLLLQWTPVIMGPCVRRDDALWGAIALHELLPIQFSNSHLRPSLRAKRSNPVWSQRRRMDCFVAALLAMTLRCDSAFPRRDTPEWCINCAPRKTEGGGNAGCPPHP